MLVKQKLVLYQDYMISISEKKHSHVPKPNKNKKYLQENSGVWVCLCFFFHLE